MKKNDSTVEVFNQDILDHATYRYTDPSLLSCRLNHNRIVDLVSQVCDFAERDLLDMGCGDGFFTKLFWEASKPRSVLGVDLAENAIEKARARQIASDVKFEIGDVYGLPYPDSSFDIVFFNAVLHHLDDPLKALFEGFRLAPQIVIFEPNGNNPGLKLIERISPYHIKHHEKSYSPSYLRQLIENAGGVVSVQQFGGFVPYFWPDIATLVMKAMEPFVENTCILKNIACAYYVVSAKRTQA